VREASRRAREYGIVFAFAAIVIVLSVTSHVFLTTRNVANILNESAPVGIMAAAGTLVFIAGGFDLSVGAIYGIAGVVAGLLVPHYGPEVASLAALAVGTGFGIVNGLLTTVGRINAFIATLSTGVIITGIALALTGGLLVTITNGTLLFVGGGRFFGLTILTWVWIGFSGLCFLVLNFSVLGRYMFAAGGNAEAARIAGVNVALVRSIAFGLSGFAAGLAGVLAASQVALGDPNSGSTIPLTVIEAIVIGGTSLFGGEGAIWRTVLGVVLLTLIVNGFDLLDINPVYQEVAQGLIVLAAVGADAWTRAGTRRSAW